MLSSDFPLSCVKTRGRRNPSEAMGLTNAVCAICSCFECVLWAAHVLSLLRVSRCHMPLVVLCEACRDFLKKASGLCEGFIPERDLRPSLLGSWACCSSQMT